MRRLIAIAAAALTLCGCNRYVGGFDDSYMKYSQMVLMNRSSKLNGKVRCVTRSLKYITVKCCHRDMQRLLGEH